MKSLVLVFAALILLSGCASVHPGSKANQYSGDNIHEMVLSAEEVTDPMKEAFSMISITFENKGDSWLRIDEAEVLIDPELADQVSLIKGRDLRDWAIAMEERARLERHNRQMSQLGLAFLGATAAVAGASNNNSTAYAAGAGGVAASQIWMVSDAVSYSRSSANRPEAVPEKHLNQKFSVPAKMFMRRWVLLNKPIGQRITDLPLRVKTVDGRETKLLVKLEPATQ